MHPYGLIFGELGLQNRLIFGDGVGMFRRRVLRRTFRRQSSTSVVGTKRELIDWAENPRRAGSNELRSGSRRNRQVQAILKGGRWELRN